MFQEKEEQIQRQKGELVKHLSSLLSRSVVSDSAAPWTAARQASLPITNSQSLLKLMSIESVMPANHLIVWRPLLLLPSVFHSIRVWVFFFFFFLMSQLFASSGQSMKHSATSQKFSKTGILCKEL